MNQPTRRSCRSVAVWVCLFCLAASTSGTAVAWNERDAVSNFEFHSQSAQVPDVVIDDPDVDLLAYLEQQLGRAVSSYAPPLIIPAADFNADSQTSDYFFSFGSGAYQAGDGCHMVPVYPPHNATLNNFFVYIYDNSPTADITFTLWRKQNGSTANPQTMAAVTSSGASTAIQILGDTSVDNAVVSQDYSYYVTTCWPEVGGQHRVQGIWIYYTAP